MAAGVDEEKAVSMVTGEDLELLLQNMELPLVVDAYATWWYVPEASFFADVLPLVRLSFDFHSFLIPHHVFHFYFFIYNYSGPCLLMAPEFEQAAQELKGKVTFVKLDTDQEEEMASRLNIMGLPTLLFLDKYQAVDDSENPDARAVLKGRIEGAMQKKSILELVEHYFFDGPAPQLF